MLEAHRTRTGGTTGPIFANSLGKPRNMNNLLNRQILPILNRCTVCHKAKGECEGPTHRYRRDESLPAWHGWHALRRGLGTNLQSLGVDLKTTQEILLHAQISTTANLYVKEVSAQSRAAMKRLERAMARCEIADEKPVILQ